MVCCIFGKEEFSEIIWYFLMILVKYGVEV